MLKPEFLINDRKGRNEKKEKKRKRRIPGRRLEESKKEKIGGKQNKFPINNGKQERGQEIFGPNKYLKHHILLVD